jgi:acetoin:2,6-dichlorophenolindophenol oxidoreductase subunit alpha
MFSLMAGKKKNKPATRKSKSARTKPKSAPRKASAKKKKAAKAKAEEIVQPVLNNEKLKELYATMLKCRMIAERVGPQSNTTVGLEAMLVGAGAHLLAQDCIAMEHGGFIASLIKGTPLKLIHARMNDSHSNGTANASPFINPTATTVSMAKGLSLARERKGQKVATLMFGTQPPGAETFEAEAMAMAAAEKLPIVFLVENTFDSRAETHTLPTASNSHEAGSAYYPRITVDGADVVAVFRVAQEAIRRAREGHGPALIACMTSRANGAAQDTDKNLKQHTAKDPLSFMEKYLRRRDLWSAEWSRRMIKEFAHELNEAVSATGEKLGDDTPFDNVYSTDFGGASHPAGLPG